MGWIGSALVLLFSLALLVAACGSSSPVVKTRIVTVVVTPTSEPEPAKWVTLDGFTEDRSILIDKINIWKNYNDRGAGVVATGRHGEEVKLIRRSGDGVFIETKSGKRGWLTYYFIKEYK